MQQHHADGVLANALNPWSVTPKSPSPRPEAHRVLTRVIPNTENHKTARRAHLPHVRPQRRPRDEERHHNGDDEHGHVKEHHAYGVPCARLGAGVGEGVGECGPDEAEDAEGAGIGGVDVGLEPVHLWGLGRLGWDWLREVGVGTGWRLRARGPRG